MTHKSEFLKRHNLPADTTLGVEKIAKLSGISLKTLREVYKRGIGAYRTNYTSVREKGTGKKGTNAPPSKKLSPQAWAISRVYSYVNTTEKGGKLKHDGDL